MKTEKDFPLGLDDDIGMTLLTKMTQPDEMPWNEERSVRVYHRGTSEGTFDTQNLRQAVFSLVHFVLFRFSFRARPRDLGGSSMAIK
jgi:hypothetical protein